MLLSFTFSGLMGFLLLDESFHWTFSTHTGVRAESSSDGKNYLEIDVLSVSL